MSEQAFSSGNATA